MKILVVDDDTAIIDVIRDTLDWKKLGIEEVLTAYDARQAKEILTQAETDLVISDIEMPGESGLDLLRWYREQGYTGRFLLLTSHESFSYASKALELHAAEYLLKPFQVDTMEMVLKQNISSLQKERNRNQAAEYGKWLMDNRAEVQRSFLDSVLNEKIQPEDTVLADNIAIRKLSLSVERSYRLVVSYVTNTESDEEQFGVSLIRFMLEDLHSGILCDSQENAWVLSYEQSNYLYVVAVCRELSEEKLLKDCRRLISEIGRRLESVVTCCVSEPCKLSDFAGTYRRLRKILYRNVIFSGEAFPEHKAERADVKGIPILDIEKIRSMLTKQDKKGIFDYLKREIDDKIRTRMMNEVQLKIIRSEFQQAVYAHLSNNGIQISRLLHDEMAVRMSEQSERSVIDLMRWVNYLLDCVFAYENETQKSETLVERIQAYVQQHYKENISRNEIGEAFHLVPEYVARVYKKKTGQILKDYINDYRIEQAQKLLKQTEMRVSDIAMETGFDNISYFSTLFRKATGMSPNEYRKV